jgi:secreted trypsin-like serine protease
MRFFSIFYLSISLMLVQTSLLATPRVINGIRAKADDWPWMAAIFSKGNAPVSGQFCGGTLIHPSWILTAAHCMDGETKSSIEVFLGATDLMVQEKGEIIGIERIIQHPDYDGQPPTSPPFDIALLQLNKAATQPPVRVAGSYTGLTQPEIDATVMGWGATRDSRYDPAYSDYLRQTTVPIVSNDICNKHRSYNGDVKDSMFCAGFAEGGTDACIGDSGGPLVIETSNGWQQIGITSWGEGCALPHYYGVYTRLSSFQSFINDTICESTDISQSPRLKVTMDEEFVTASWNNVAAEGYQLYYAPYSKPISDVTMDNIANMDIGKQTSLGISLSQLKSAFQHNLYVAVRAYNGNCYSNYSNLVRVMIYSNDE